MCQEYRIISVKAFLSVECIMRHSHKSHVIFIIAKAKWIAFFPLDSCIAFLLHFIEYVCADQGPL